MSSRRGMPAYVEDYDETTGTVDQDNRQVASTKKSKAHDRLQARRNRKGIAILASQGFHSAVPNIQERAVPEMRLLLRRRK
jgi:hypothetical protein